MAPASRPREVGTAMAPESPGSGAPDTSVGPLPTRPGALLVQKLGFGAWRGSGSGAVSRGRCSQCVFSMRNRAATGAEPGWRAGPALAPRGV